MKLNRVILQLEEMRTNNYRNHPQHDPSIQKTRLCLAIFRSQIKQAHSLLDVLYYKTKNIIMNL